MINGTQRLCKILYGRRETAADYTPDYLGGSSAQILHDAASFIEDLRPALERTYRNAETTGQFFEHGPMYSLMVSKYQLDEVRALLNRRDGKLKKEVR